MAVVQRLTLLWCVAVVTALPNPGEFRSPTPTSKLKIFGVTKQKMRSYARCRRARHFKDDSRQSLGLVARPPAVYRTLKGVNNDVGAAPVGGDLWSGGIYGAEV